VTAFVRLHPCCRRRWTRSPPWARSSIMVRRCPWTWRSSVEEMWRQTHRTHRNQINKARRPGVEIVVDDWSHFDEWIGVYHDNMRRVGASDYYFFPPAHFDTLRRTLGDRTHLAVAVAGGELLGGNLFFEYRGFMHTYLQATRDGPAALRRQAALRRGPAVGPGPRATRCSTSAAGSAVQHDSLFAYKGRRSPRAARLPHLAGGDRPGRVRGPAGAGRTGGEHDVRTVPAVPMSRRPADVACPPGRRGLSRLIPRSWSCGCPYAAYGPFVPTTTPRSRRRAAATRPLHRAPARPGPRQCGPARPPWPTGCPSRRAAAPPRYAR
jgi:hypothetical protein